MPKLNVEKHPARKPRKPTIAPNYTLAPAEPCPFVAVPVPAAVPVAVPAFVAALSSDLTFFAFRAGRFAGVR